MAPRLVADQQLDARAIATAAPSTARARPSTDSRSTAAPARVSLVRATTRAGPIGSSLRPGQAWGWVMLTIQPMPNRSTHMPNSSPQICFSSGTDTVPLSESRCQ